MRKLTVDELKQIIENHGHWIREDVAGWEHMKAYLQWADLHGANLQGADLHGANLHGANLHGADLKWANLQGADLQGANLHGADLHGANLHGANLHGADLHGADLQGANLHGADLKWADLHGADLRGAKNIPYIPITCPDAGAFIAWKKVNGYIVKLQIPEDAKRCSATSRKCRCDKALVLAIEKPDGTDAGITTLTNTNYVETVYTVGEMVFPDSWDENRWHECSHGIHFFVNRQEAVNW